MRVGNGVYKLRNEYAGMHGGMRVGIFAKI